MRAVIVGASGFLGSALAAAFAREGADLLCTARNPVAASARAHWPQARARWIAADFDRVPPASFWAAQLRPGDVVVNAAGVLRERRSGEFTARHHSGPAQLFDACAAVGVGLVIQISALGAAPDAASRYHRSKDAADRHLQACDVPSVIVKPSLVWAAEGASARLFAALAVLPLLALPGGGRQPLQPVFLDDLVCAIVALAAQGPQRGSRTVEMVGPEPVSLRDYLGSLRSQLGFARDAWVLPVSERLFLLAAGLAGHWRGSFLDRETAQMLLHGNTAPASGIAALLGRAPRSPRDFIAPDGAQGLRRLAWLHWMEPLLRFSIALVWIWTFAVSIGLYPRDQSLELLARVGAHGALASLLLNGAALFDLALGLATLMLPARLRARFLWPLQLALIGFYTVTISIAMPEFWLHPFGPLSKNLPLCAAILLLWALDAPMRPRRR